MVAASLLAACALVAAPTTGSATAKLWLYPQDGGPRAGGHVVDSVPFTLVVENVGGGGGHDDNTAYGVALVVAVNDLGLLTSGVLTVPEVGDVVLETASYDFGLPTLPCSGKTVPPHGVYPADFLTVALGDIASGQSIEIVVDVQGEAGLEVHFDATATGWRQAGPTTKCYDVVNPSGHDVTVSLSEGDVEPACPSVTITKSVTIAGVELLDEVDFTIEVSNTGACDLTEVVVTDQLPTVDDGAGGVVPVFSVIATDPPATTESDELVSWQVIDPLGAGVTGVFTITAELREPLADGHELENTACVSAAELAEPACSSVEVAVGEEPAEGFAASPGFWCNRIRLAAEDKPGASFTIEELTALLEEVNLQSTVFSELVDASDLGLAQDLLCGSHGPSAVDRLVRQLLALRLNVVSGRVDPELALDALCAGDEQLPADVDGSMTVAEVLTGAEADLWADAERATLLQWMEIIDFINNASLADGEGCADEEEVGVQLRRGRRLRRR